MDKTNVYLSYYEVMILLYEFEELKLEEDNYVSLLVRQYTDYFLEQLQTNTLKGMEFRIPDIVLKNFKIYVMSVSLYDMLLKMTGVNLDDKYLKKYYKNYLKSYERYMLNSELLKNYKKLVRKKV